MLQNSSQQLKMKKLNEEFRRSNCLRQPFPPLPPQRPSQLNKLKEMNPTPNGPQINQQRKKPPYIDYTTLTKIFKKKNIQSMKQGFSIQQCASILLPIIFSSLLIVVCVIAALALLTDGFSLCSSKLQKELNGANEGEIGANLSQLCLTHECIKKAYFLIDRLDRSTNPCDNFFAFACGRSTRSNERQSTRFELELRAKLEQKPRPSFPLPYRLLFDFYDSCVGDEFQEQLATQPFNTLISRLGGWSLLQNAKFDAENFEWEALEAQLHSYAIDGLFSWAENFDKNEFLVSQSTPLLSQYRRQALEEYFMRLLIELDVDEELAEKAIHEALDFEASLSSSSKPLLVKLTIEELKKKFPTIKWEKLISPQKILNENQKETMVVVDGEFVEKLVGKLDKDGKDGEEVKRPLSNYLMLRLLHSLSPHLPRRYRVSRERLDNRFETRWHSCFNEMLNFMPMPLYGFGFDSEETLTVKENSGENGVNLKRISQQLSKAKEQVAKQLRLIPWIDPKTKERMLKNLHNLRTLPNLFSGAQASSQLRALYSGERLDPTSYFDNVLMLRQIGGRPAYKILHNNHNWAELLLGEGPEIDVNRNEMVYGPVSLQLLVQLPETVQLIQMRRHILEYLFHSDALTEWKPEPRSILQAKFHCFEKDLNNPNTLIYDQMALQAADQDELSDNNLDDDLKLPGLGDYSQKQLMYIAFAASRCSQIAPTEQEAQKSINQILQNSDSFSDAFHCQLGAAMNPRDKCAIL